MARRAAFHNLLVFVVVSGCTYNTTNVYVGNDAGMGPVDAGPLFAIGGTVNGLEGASVTLVLNSSEFVEVTKDGPFVFPQKVASGPAYLVSVLRTSDGRMCAVQNGEGHVDAADVTNVVVVCPSPNAQLASLVFAPGGLMPAFSRDILSYTAMLSGVTDVTITATAASPGATLTINGTPASSGQPSVVKGLGNGRSTISIVVRAADGVTQKTYTIAAS